MGGTESRGKERKVERGEGEIGEKGERKGWREREGEGEREERGKERERHVKRRKERWRGKREGGKVKSLDVRHHIPDSPSADDVLVSQRTRSSPGAVGKPGPQFLQQLVQ